MARPAEQALLQEVTLMKFEIVEPGTNRNVLGGTVGEDNAYINTYGAPRPGQQPPLKLAVGESSLVTYHLSGSTGTYEVRRVE
jgi:hypothetical protein